MLSDPITKFSGSFRFLSNFWLTPIEYWGVSYPSVEHGYQAAKCINVEERKAILNCAKPGDAKRMGREVALRPEWEKVKLEIMLGLLRIKFSNTGLRERLLATGQKELVEGNSWHDLFYGVCDGNCNYGPHAPSGENQLGRLLMQVRSELQ